MCDTAYKMYATAATFYETSYQYLQTVSHCSRVGTGSTALLDCARPPCRHIYHHNITHYHQQPIAVWWFMWI